MVTETNHIQVYRVSEHNRIHNIHFEDKINCARVDYKNTRLLVSTTKNIYVVEGGSIVEDIKPPVDDFKFIFPLYKMYLIVSSRGILYWCNNLKF